MHQPREFVIGYFGRAPITVHWSVLLALPISWLLTKNFIDGLAGFVAYLALVLAHELGHAVVARRHHTTVLAIKVYWLHGLCIYEAPNSFEIESRIAWGGVVAQLLLFGFVALFASTAWLINMTLPAFLSPMFFIWMPFNLLLACNNMLPVLPFDGAKAWRLLPILFRRKFRFSKRQKPFATKRKPVAKTFVSDGDAEKVVSLALERIARGKSED